MLSTCTPRAQALETNYIGRPRSNTGYQESTYKTSNVPRRNRAPQGVKVQNTSKKVDSRRPVPSNVELAVAAGGQVEGVVIKRYKEGRG